MTPVFQTNVSPDRGDCTRAVIASLLDLELEQVPNFRLFPDDTWHHVFNGFLWGCGYEWDGVVKVTIESPPSFWPSINGYYSAGVPSKTFPDVYHSVIVNGEGVVTHDPNPNGLWLGRNIFEASEQVIIDIIKKRDDYPFKGDSNDA